MSEVYVITCHNQNNDLKYYNGSGSDLPAAN